jgi:hypothetical protein
MTVINQTELARLTKLDQVLMWSIISINASNLDPRNTNISDNAAIRAESRDYITWQVVQDENGKGIFSFTALLPIVNPHPLESKRSILERVWSYSPFDPAMVMDEVEPYDGYGFDLPSLPIWIETTEHLLAYCAELATNIAKLAPLITGTAEEIAGINSKLWGSCQYQITDSAYGSQMAITGYLTIDWRKYMRGDSLIRCLNPWAGHASNINCNFPDLNELWATVVDLTLPVEELLTLIPTGTHRLPLGGSLPREIAAEENTAESLIDSYGQNYFVDDALPDWYKDIIDNPPNLQVFQTGIGSMSSKDSTAPKLIESLPICKEQDPAVVNYGKSPLAKVLAQ